MSIPFRWFSKRRKVKNKPWPSTHWRSFVIGTLGLVVVSFAALDMPVGMMSGELNPIVLNYGAFVTDFGKSDWILMTSFFVFIAALIRARFAIKNAIRMKVRSVHLAQAACFVFSAVALSGIAVNLIKKSIGRARPSQLSDDIGILSFHFFEFNSKFASFPSGHSTTTAAIFAAAAFLFPRYRVHFVSLAVCIAMSRAIVGAHYPSDVFAGLAFGAWCTYATAIVFARYRMVFNINEAGWPVRRNNFVFTKVVPRSNE